MEKIELNCKNLIIPFSSKVEFRKFNEHVVEMFLWVEITPNKYEFVSISRFNKESPMAKTLEGLYCIYFRELY